MEMRKFIVEIVALRKESVDRNMVSMMARPQSIVALRKESVDRNTVLVRPSHAGNLSLSARRAWIEITTACSNTATRSSRSPQGERG